MGIQICLVLQIGLFVFADIMVEQGNRDDQRNIAAMILTDDFEQFLFFIGCKELFKMSHQVLKHIDIFLDGGLELQGCHQKSFVICIKILDRKIFGSGDQFVHLPVMGRVMGKNHQLMPGVKVDYASDAALFR